MIERIGKRIRDSVNPKEPSGSFRPTSERRGGIFMIDGKSVAALRDRRKIVDYLTVIQKIVKRVISVLSLFLMAVCLNLAGTVESSHAWSIHDTPFVSLNWGTGSEGYISSDGSTVSPNHQSIRLLYTVAGNISASVVLTEKLNGNTVNTVTTNNHDFDNHIDDSDYPGFDDDNSKEYRYGANFTYGVWYRKLNHGPCNSRSCENMVFVSNADAIKNLASGSLVTSTFKWTVTNGTVSRSDEITVYIERLVNQGDVVVRIAEESTESEVFEGEDTSVQVELNPAQSNPITVEYTLSEISAESDVDYTEPTTKSVTFNAGDTRKTIAVPISTDSAKEETEQFRITLSSGTGFTLRHYKKHSIVSIRDNYIPTITAPGNSCNNFSYNNGQKPANGPPEHIEAYFSLMPSNVYQLADSPFNLELKFKNPDDETNTNSKHDRQMYVVAFDEDNDEAGVFVDGNHYFYFDVKAAETSKSRLVPRVNDSHKGYLRYRLVPREQDHISWFDITTPCEFHVWYVDAFKPGVALTVGSNTVLESASVQLTATATPAPSRDVVVPITISDTSRFQNASNLSITIPAGQASGTLDVKTRFMSGDQTADSITITANTDNKYWLDSSVSSQNVSIEDIDGNPVNFESTETSIVVSENETLELPFELGQPAGASDSVGFQISTAGIASGEIATEGTDFSAPTSPISIGTGESEGKITISILDDLDVEPTEKFKVILIDNNEIIAGTRKEITVSIIDNDAPAIVGSSTSCSDVYAPQGVSSPQGQAHWLNLPRGPYWVAGTNPNVKIGLKDPATGQPLIAAETTQFLYKSFNIGGTEHESSGMLEGPAGSSQTAVLPIEASDFRGYLRYRIEPRGATPPEQWYYVGQPCEFHIWIVGADRPGISLSIDENTVSENGSFTVRATATPAPTGRITIPIRFSGTSLVQPPASSAVVIEPDQSSGTLQVTAGTVPANQTAENIVVSADWRSSYLLDDMEKQASITLSKSPISVEFDSETLNPTVYEYMGNLELKVVLSNAITKDVSVSYSVAGRSAMEGADFTVSGSMVAIKAGETTGLIPITIVPSVEKEDSESVVVTLMNPSPGIVLGTNVSTTLTIRDGDGNPINFETTSTSTEVNESGILELPIVLGYPAAAPITVIFEISNNDFALEVRAVAGTDFSPPASPVSIGIDESRGKISISIHEDTDVEATEKFKVTLLGSGEIIAGTRNEITVSIIDDDAPAIASSGTSCRIGGTPEGVTVTEPRYQASWRNLPTTPYWVAATNHTARIRFINTTGQASNVSVIQFLYRAFNFDGSVHQNSGMLEAATRSGLTEVLPSEASDFRGYLRYRIIPRDATSLEQWYFVSQPCEFHIWIVDADRPGITLSIDENTVSENGSFTVRATATPTPTGRITIPIRFSGTSLVQPPASSEVVIEAGQSSGTLQVDSGTVPMGQSVEDIIATADWRSSYWLDASAKSASITLAKGAISVEFADESIDQTVFESAGDLELKVVLSDAIAKDVTVDYHIAGRIAVEGADFIASGTMVTIKAGETTGLIPITIVQSVEKEDTESLVVTLRNPPTGIVLGTNASTTLTIRDGQGKVITVRVSDSQIMSGESAVFEISANPVPTEELLVPLKITQQGDVVRLRPPSFVRIGANMESTSFSVATGIDLPKGITMGSITVQALNVLDYETLDSTAVVNVLEQPEGSKPAKYSIAGNVIKSILLGSEPSSPSTKRTSIPLIEIIPVESAVNEGETIEFRVTVFQGLKSVAGLTVPVELTEKGNFIGGSRIETVSLEANDTEASVSVPTIDDNLAEEDGFVTATISEGPEYTVGVRSSATIRVIDHADRKARNNEIHAASQDVLPDMIASLSARSLEATTTRVSQAFSQGLDTAFEIGGRTRIEELIQSAAKDMDEGGIDWRQAIGDSSIAVDLFPEANGAAAGTVWAIGDRRTVSNENNALLQDWNGDILTGHFGFDTKFGGNSLIGLSTFVTESEAGYTGFGSETFAYDVQSTGIQPYIAYSSPDGEFLLQASAGYGTGDIRIDQNPYETLYLDSTVQLMTLHAHQQLFHHEDFFGGTGSLSFKGEGWLAEQRAFGGEHYISDIHSKVGNLQLALEGVRVQNLAGGQSIQTAASFGLLGSSKNRLSVAEMEIAGNVSFEDPVGVGTFLSGRALIDQLDLFHEWNLKGTLKLDFDNDLRGIQLQVESSYAWQQNADDSDKFWNEALVQNNLGPLVQTEGWNVSSETGYGFTTFEDRGLLTPYAGLDYAELGRTELRLGAKLNIEPVFELNLDSSHGFEIDGGSVRKIVANGSVQW